jgi:hypothetical protein
MAAFIVLVIFVTVVAAGFAARRWLGGRLSFPKVHSKKQDEDGVEIVVQKPAHERRLKLSLPDISYVQIRSPVGPMKSSIRSALKELRSRQMVQSLCSRFETRMKVACDPDESAKEAPNKPTLETTQAVQPKTRRRDASVSAVSLASGLAKEAEITANARSNNLSKFLRSYASNLDNAISAERRVVMSTDAISVERRVVMTTDAEDDVEQPLLAKTDESATPSSEVVEDVDDSGIELGTNVFSLALTTRGPIAHPSLRFVLVQSWTCTRYSSSRSTRTRSTRLRRQEATGKRSRCWSRRRIASRWLLTTSATKATTTAAPSASSPVPDCPRPSPPQTTPKTSPRSSQRPNPRAAAIASPTPHSPASSSRSRPTAGATLLHCSSNLSTLCKPNNATTALQSTST